MVRFGGFLGSVLKFGVLGHLRAVVLRSVTASPSLNGTVSVGYMIDRVQRASERRRIRCSDDTRCAQI